MNKRILVIFIAVLFALTLLSCSNDKNKQNSATTTATIEPNAENSEKTSEITTEIITGTEITENDSNVFNYELKGEYISLSDIDKEEDELYAAYANFTAENSKMPEKEKLKNQSIYNKLVEQLRQYSKNLTYSDEEIKSSKKAEFDSRVNFWESEIIMMSKRLEYSGPENGTDPTYYQYMYEYARKTYKQALAIKEEYESGKITLEQALKKVKKLKYEF